MNHPYLNYHPWYNPMHDNRYYNYWNTNWNPHYCQCNHQGNDFRNSKNAPDVLKDYGPNPFVININEASKQNPYFRTALWTGSHLQVTLMSIPVGESIGLEMHPNVDQFLRIEDGEGFVQMGKNKDRLDFQARVHDEFAIMVPAGTWHNLTNTGNKPIKLYSIYAPPQHPHGTVHQTKAIAMAEHD